MKCRERVDRFPTHKWIARAVLPLFVMQRWTQFVDNDTFDSLMIGYLWWVSEVTLHESWLARKELETSG